MLLGLRLQRGHLQTVSRTLYRSRDGRTITSVGTCHIGERRYFNELAEHICSLKDKGAQMHCKGVHNAKDDRDGRPSTDRLAAISHLYLLADRVGRRVIQLRPRRQIGGG